MTYTDFLGNRVSTLGMGNMRLPTKGTDAWGEVDWDAAQKLIDLCFQSGINYFDTAYVYHKGDSERFLGEALKGHDRSSYFLATKFLVTANPDYRAVLSEQLDKLKTDYIDYYLIHSIQSENENAYIACGAIDYFLGERKAGRVRHLGFSFHGPLSLLEKYLTLENVKKSGGWDFVQIQFNYLDYYYGDARALYERIEREGLPIIVMEPVRGGALATFPDAIEDKLESEHPWSAASWALRFVRNFPAVKVVLSGMHDLSQLNDNIATFSDDTKLSTGDLALIKELSQAHKSQISIPCTACHYCCDACVKSLDIPLLISLYNEHEYVLDFLKPSIKEKIKSLPQDKAPSNCLGCGACCEHCPQHIDIPLVMQRLTALTK